jgi:hypothetical protein
MLRTNLSTRPFYNERAVHVVLGIAALLVLTLTAFNVFRIRSLSQHSTELAKQVSNEQAEADRLTQQAAEIRRTIDKDELQLVANAASEANSLIDQRTFSWTAFFNTIESTMPPDVMLTAVRPSTKDGQTRVLMNVLGRRTEDVEEFIEKLEATGGFEGILTTRSDFTDDGLYRATLEGAYTGLFEDAEPEQRATPPDAEGTPNPTAPTAEAPKSGRKPDPATPGERL